MNSGTFLILGAVPLLLSFGAGFLFHEIAVWKIAATIALTEVLLAVAVISPLTNLLADDGLAALLFLFIVIFGGLGRCCLALLAAWAGRWVKMRADN